MLIGYQTQKKPRPQSDTQGSSSFIHEHVEGQSIHRKGSSDGQPAKTAPFIATINSKAAFYSKSSIYKPVELNQSFPPGVKEGNKVTEYKSKKKIIRWC